jgi:hypothetical protein
MIETDRSTSAQDPTSTNYSFKTETHSFDIHLAEKYSVEEAILIKHFAHWIGVNRRLNRNFHDGRWWTYQTIEEIAAHFPYWSWDQVKRLLIKLVDKKVLLKGNFNKTSFDRTVWYAFNDESPTPQAISPNGKDDIATPIPDTKPDTKPIEKEIYKEKKPAPEEKIAYGEHVKLRPSEYQALEANHSKPALDEMIGRINDYLASTGIKPYKDYAATIRIWFGREKKTPADSNDIKAKNLKIAWEAKKYLEKFKAQDMLSITSWAVEIKTTGDSISFDLPKETFKEILSKAVNIIAQNASETG